MTRRQMNRRSATNRIKELLEADPLLTYQQLGDAVGVTKQRAHQIVKNNNLEKSFPWTGKTFSCNGGCGKRLYYTLNKGGYCRKCRKRKNSFTFNCSHCGKEQTLIGRDASRKRVSLNKGANIYCNASCRTSGEMSKYWQKESTHVE